MRDIKFRVWNGEAMITENVVFLGKSGFAIDLDGMDWDFEFGRFGKPELVGMQYTGLKDKNGVEIYDGDILRSTSYGYISIVTVSRLDGGYVVNGRSIKNVQINSKYVVGYEFYVIGNIHQNPELLGN